MTVLAAACLLALQSGAGDVDVVHLKDGSIHKGRILSETATTIRLEIFGTGSKGQTVGTFSFTLRKKEIARIERGSDAARKRAEERVQAFETETQRKLAELSKLKPREQEVEGRAGWRLVGTHFDLHATCGKNEVREAALSLERIFRSYLRYFEIRHNAGKRVKVLFFGDYAQYGAYQRRRADRTISASAFYDPVGNVIVTFDHSRELEKRLEGRPGGDKALRQLHGKVDELMSEAFYHEAFHAFASNYLWKGDTQWRFPRWLHEGMATYFQTSVVEEGRLVHGAPPPELVPLLKKALEDGTMVPLSRLLKADPRSFIGHHGGAEEGSLLHYAESWALVHLLVHRMDREKLSAYTSAVMDGRDPIAAFEKLAGAPLPKVDEELRGHIRKLK